MSAARNDFELRAGHEFVNAAADGERDHRVIFAPEDEGGYAEGGDSFIEAFAAVAGVLQDAVDGVTVVALEVLAVGELDQAVGRQALVVEEKLKDVAHVREGGDVQVDGQLGHVAPDTGGVDQNELVDLLRKVERVAGGDPTAE